MYPYTEKMFGAEKMLNFIGPDARTAYIHIENELFSEKLSPVKASSLREFLTKMRIRDIWFSMQFDNANFQAMPEFREAYKKHQVLWGIVSLDNFSNGKQAVFAIDEVKLTSA
jgi:hypothetical protein